MQGETLKFIKFVIHNSHKSCSFDSNSRKAISHIHGFPTTSERFTVPKFSTTLCTEFEAVSDDENSQETKI